MPESIVIAQFERRLGEMGCPLRRMKANVQELAEHYEDLKQAAMNEGLSEKEANAQASAQLGNPIMLAENAVTLLRQSSWWGRHPIIGFCLLPLPGFILGWSLYWSSIAGLGRLGALFGPAYNLDKQSLDALNSDPKVFHTFADPLNAGVGVVTTLIVLTTLYWFARRAALGLKWILVACVACALLNIFTYSQVFPHSLVYGLAFYSPHWLTALLPLLIGIALFIVQRRRQNRLVEIPMPISGAQNSITFSRPAFYRVPTYWVMALLTLAFLILTCIGIKTHSNHKIQDARLESKVWPAERAATLALIKIRQSANPAANEETINLTPWLNAKLADQMPGSSPKTKGNNLSELPMGVHTFGGVAFDVEGRIQLADLPLLKKTKLPVHVEIPIGRKCSQISLLHGAMFMSATDMKVALIILHYEDGSQTAMEIIGGKDVLDWWGPIYNTDSGIGRYTTSPGTELAWAGSNPGIEKNAPDFSLRLYRSTFANPHPELEISSIDYVSSLSEAIPFLVGLTIEKP